MPDFAHKNRHDMHDGHEIKGDQAQPFREQPAGCIAEEKAAMAELQRKNEEVTKQNEELRQGASGFDHRQSVQLL